MSALKEEIVYMTEISIPPITKKNSQQLIPVKKNGKRRYIPIPSEQYKEYESAAGKYLKANQKIDYPVNVQAVFYTKTRGNVDLTNLLSAICDVLVHYQVVEDDNRKIVFSHDGSRVFWDKVNPRTELVITKI